MEILQNLEPLLRTFWYIAIPTSLIFIIQTILTFIGADAFDGVEADFDGDLDGADASFQLLSFRNFINFLLGLSWTGISFHSSISNPTLLIALSITVGCFFVYIFFILMVQLHRLAEDNSFNIQNTLNKTGEVYLTIPENMKGKGKIMVSVKGSTHELDAMTRQEKLMTGSAVRVVEIEGGNVLIVESI